MPVPFSQVTAVFPAPWIIKSGLLSTEPHHFWMTFLTPFMEVIQWLCTACFYETGSFIHFSWDPLGWELGIFFAMGILVFLSYLTLVLHALCSSTEDEPRVQLPRYNCPQPSCDLPPRERTFNRNYYPLAWKLGPDWEDSSTKIRASSSSNASELQHEDREARSHVTGVNWECWEGSSLFHKEFSYGSFFSLNSLCLCDGGHVNLGTKVSDHSFAHTGCANLGELVHISYPHFWSSDCCR